MIYLNPKDFEGCENDERINMSKVSTYFETNTDTDSGHSIYFNFSGRCLYWCFDTKENRDKAIKKIDEICKDHSKVLQQIADNLDNIQGSL